MKFNYQYRTPDNRIHNGVIKAASKEAAYAALKSRGIKPSRVEDAPGLWNKIFGKGKRWIAIGLLSAIVAFGSVYFYSGSVSLPEYSERGQIYADASVMQLHESKGWSDTFKDAGDSYLALFAQPGRIPDQKFVSARPSSISINPVRISSSDSYEVVRMKCMVNGMKRELGRYLKAGGSIGGYMDRLLDRQLLEKRIEQNLTTEIDGIRRLAEVAVDKNKYIVLWQDKNKILRDMGFRTIPLPEEWEWLQAADRSGEKSPLTASEKK